jgi:putative transposase
VGTIDLAVPKLRAGAYNPEFLLTPRRRAEQALMAVVRQAYVEGVSTRRVDDLVKAMGIEGISRSEVSRMAAELDATVGEFRERPLDTGPYRYLWIDALTQRVRERRPGRERLGGDRHRCQRRGTPRDRRVRPGDHRGHGGVDRVPPGPGGPGLVGGRAGDLRRSRPDKSCHRHRLVGGDLAAVSYPLYGASRVPKGNWSMIATLVRSVFEQPDRDATWTQLGDVIDKLTAAGFCDPALYILDAADDILAFTAFPTEHWPKIRSNNPQERLNKEIRRRTDVVGNFPNRRAVIRLVGAVLAEQTGEWAIAKRYMSAESLKIPAVVAPSLGDPRPAIEAAQAGAGGGTIA